MSDYALGKKAIAVCDRCGFQYKLHQLKPQFTDLKNTGLLVCPTCLDEENPQLQLGRWPVDDPQAVRNPRPDTGMEASRYGDNVRWEFSDSSDNWVSSRRGVITEGTVKSLATGTTVGSFGWSPDGEKIVFNLTSTGSLGTITTRTLVPIVTTFPSSGKGDVDTYPSYSPDGTKIAFVSGPTGEADGNQIYTMDADGSNISSALTSHAKASSMPRWSPDGNQLVFYRHVSTSPDVYDIYRIDADGSNETRLTDSSSTAGKNTYYANYAPSLPKKIVFSSDRSGDWEIYQMDNDGNNITKISDNSLSEYWPDYSPDGSMIQYFGPYTGTDPVNWEISTMDWDGSNPSRFTTVDGSPRNYDGSWGPTGNYIGYIHIDGSSYTIRTSSYTIAHSGDVSTTLTYNSSDNTISVAGVSGQRRPSIMISDTATGSSSISIDASKYNYVRMAIKKDSSWLSSSGGSGWSGRLFWNTSSGGDFSYRKSISVPEPSWNSMGDPYVVLVWEVGEESDWTGTIDKLKIELNNIELYETWSSLGSYTIDYIRVEAE